MATDVLAPTTQIVTSILPAATVAPTTHTVIVSSTHDPIFVWTSSLSASSTSGFSTTSSTSPTSLPGGLSASAKIGIGLGVPLGVIVLAIVAFQGYLYGKRRGNKRNAIAAADEQFHGFPGDKNPSAMQRQDGAGAVGPQQSDDIGELPRYAEELEGSPVLKRHELPAQRDSTGSYGIL